MSGMTHTELTHRLSHDVGSLLGWIKRTDAVDYSTGDVPFLVPKAKSRKNGARYLTCYNSLPTSCKRNQTYTKRGHIGVSRYDLFLDNAT